ncbi:AAA domain-containing protein [Leptolyngbya ohadii]|uniref:AAA domain-containing protein n=1 Tax=Leptolyngbya ohadii TaxID=1962290 RepID=UPI0015C5D6AF|nr:AAA domain-containing protein [Leptolyngbya ohadii]
MEEGKSLLCPLFSIDITQIFKGSYQAQGWNIENFEMAEAGGNLATFLNFEEEQLKQLVTKEGLRRFLETTFNIEFRTLEDWMRRISLPQYRVIKRPYLFEFKGGGFSFNLRRDVNAIRENQDKEWLQPGHPAYEYLFGIPKSSADIEETLYLGAFLTDPPTDSQLKVLKHAQSEPVTAVQGPPGSGKTTLILHLIAQQVVKRALSIIETGEDINNLTVVSSTNNQAVDNVIDRLSRDLPNGFFYLNGGSRKIIDGVDGAKERLQAALDFLQDSSFDESRQNDLAQQIRQLKQNLIVQERQHQKSRRQRQADENRLPQAQRELQTIRQRIDSANTAKDQSERRAVSLAAYESLPELAYRQLQSQFQIVQLELPEEAPPWWKNFIYWLLRRTERQVLSKMLNRCQPAINQTLGTAFEIKPPLDRRALLRQTQRLEEGLDRLQELRTVRAAVKQRSQEIADLRHSYEERQREIREIDRRLAEPITDFYHTFHTEYHEQQRTLFDLSQQFLVQEALKRKTEVKDALEIYQKVLPDGTRQADADEARRAKPIIADKLCKTLSLMFPVITCTLLSVRNMLPWIKECVDRVIVDESGMIPLHYTFPLLVRSRKAIVVGDPLQIEPIMNQSQQTLNRYFQEAFLNQSLNQTDYCRYSPNEIGTATTYHRAAGATGEENDLGQGIRLLEHYRCQPNIIAYCERIAKYGLITKTVPQKSLIGPNLVAYHVDGTITANVNQDEIVAVHEIIQHLIRHGYSPREIGVISAFRAQADALKKSLVTKFPELKDAIGTVHTFQGSERRVIILSTKVCRRQDSISWINQRPNLLNVAVSRAKELFILVGNLHRLEEEKSGIYTRQLVQHIREQGLVLEYKTAAEVNPERLSAAGSSPIYDCDHLKVLQQALREAEQELFVVAPRIQGEAAQQFSQDVLAVLRRGIRVTIVYGSPNSNSHSDGAQETQAERKFRELFAKYSCASLIRAKGDGTNQRILLCDNKFAVVGSWNWLSHVYLSTCQQNKNTGEAQIRRETSVRLSEAMAIEEIREEIADLIEESL